MGIARDTLVLDAHGVLGELNVVEICEGLSTHWTSVHMSIARCLHDVLAAVQAQQVCAVDFHWVTFEVHAHWAIEVIHGSLDLIAWWRRD